jgi:hypothetical protein
MISIIKNHLILEDFDGPALSAFAVVKQRGSVIGWVTKNYYLELLRASKSTLSNIKILNCWHF